jgi:methyltransferase family protein
MLAAACERILHALGDDAVVLAVGGWAEPFDRADWVLDALPFETRGAATGAGRGERFSARTWIVRDPCDREPWPFRDAQFDFAVCVGTLERVRDPIWVCSELARVARAGYVEVPAVEAELVFDAEGEGPWLGHEDHRWFVALQGGELVFTHKLHSIHHDWSLRAQSAWRGGLGPGDRRQGLFWDGALPARERLLVGADHAAFRAELRERLVARFAPSQAEQRVKQARDAAARGLTVARRPVRRAAEGLIGRLGSGGGGQSTPGDGGGS